MAAACHRHNPPPVDLVPLARQARGRVRIAGGGKQRRGLDEEREWRGRER